jgi:hypothetical protein
MSATLGRSFLAIALTPVRTRGVIATALVAGAVAGFAVGASAAAPSSEAELTMLLRAMALLKLAFVAVAAGGIWWRLTAPISTSWLAGYAAASAAMAAGPGLIWFLSHIGLASILLHGGFATSILLLWRDPATARLLDATILQRRAIL